MNDQTPSNDDTTIDAIPTTYDGTTFRSRLEARWAATLNTFGITWTYEPETITLPSGTIYIPDFWLPELGTWIEAKGTGVPRVEKAVELGESRACHCDDECTCRWPGGELVLIGHPPKPYSPRNDPRYADAPAWTPRRHRDHGGHPVWSTAHGRSAWLNRCQSCRRMSWWTGPHCRACEAPAMGGHAHFSGGVELEFARQAGWPVASTLPPEAQALFDAFHSSHNPEA